MMVLVLSYPCFLYLIPLFPYELDNKHTERSDLGFHMGFRSLWYAGVYKDAVFNDVRKTLCNEGATISVDSPLGKNLPYWNL